MRQHPSILVYHSGDEQFNRQASNGEFSTTCETVPSLLESKRLLAHYF